MDDNKKATFTDREIEGIAKAIALADLAARSPKEKNPSRNQGLFIAPSKTGLKKEVFFAEGERRRKKYVNQKLTEP